MHTRAAQHRCNVTTLTTPPRGACPQSPTRHQKRNYTPTPPATKQINSPPHNLRQHARPLSHRSAVSTPRRRRRPPGMPAQEHLRVQLSPLRRDQRPVVVHPVVRLSARPPIRRSQPAGRGAGQSVTMLLAVVLLKSLLEAHRVPQGDGLLPGLQHAPAAESAAGGLVERFPASLAVALEPVLCIRIRVCVYVRRIICTPGPKAKRPKKNGVQSV